MNIDIDKIRKALVMAHSAFMENGYAEEEQLAEALAELDKVQHDAAGLTVEEAYDVWRSFHFRHQNDGEQYMDYLEARNAAYRARLTAAIEAKASKL